MRRDSRQIDRSDCVENEFLPLRIAAERRWTKHGSRRKPRSPASLPTLPPKLRQDRDVPRGRCRPRVCRPAPGHPRPSSAASPGGSRPSPPPMPRTS